MCGIGFILNELEKLPIDKIIKHGFNNPHSYRGDYQELGVEYKKDATVGEMIDCLKSAINQTFTGYKGGEFMMYSSTDVYIVKEYGESSNSEKIGAVYLAYVTGQDVNFDWVNYGDKYEKLKGN